MAQTPTTSTAQSTEPDTAKNSDAATPQSNTKNTQSNKKKPFVTAGKALLNDPLLHSLVSGLVVSAARKQGSKNGLGNTVIAFASARIARQSLPAALLLGAGFLAKNWYDIRREKTAKAAATQAKKDQNESNGGIDKNNDGVTLALPHDDILAEETKPTL